MLIIVEGVDCAGKSTLVNEIVKQLDPDSTKVLSKGLPRSSSYIIEYLWPLAGYIPDSTQNIICDRWHIGELVYPSVFGRQSIMGYTAFDNLQTALRHLGALVVYLEPPFSQVLDRYTKRGDKLIKDSDMLLETYCGYRKAVDEHLYYYDENNIILHNFTADEHTARTIITAASTLERTAGVDYS